MHIVAKKKEAVIKNHADSWYFEDHDKIENFKYLLNTGRIKKDDKVLVMTQFNQGFSTELATMLNGLEMKWTSVQTPGMRLMTIIDKYQNSDLNCLILNTTYYGAGLNLEMTDHVIFLHKMPLDVEVQAIGRAQRIGRKSRLNVWKLYDMYEVSNE
jgi:SNF2 family DNA or RNA helicase